MSRFPPLEPSGHFSGEVQSSRLLPPSSQARTQERPRKRRNGRGESPCQQRTMNRLVFLPGRCSAPKDCSCLQTQILPPADSTGCCRCFQCCQRQPGRSPVKVNVSLLKSFYLGVLDAAVRECLLQSPDEVKGSLVHHHHRPGQLHLPNAGQVIQVETWGWSLNKASVRYFHSNCKYKKYENDQHRVLPT